MASENHDNNTRPNTVYTLSSGVYQGNVNHGFHPDQQQTPPPAYEDVISGEYLKWKDTSYLPPPPWTDQPTNVTIHRTTTTPQFDPSTESVTSSEEEPKKCRIYFAWVSFVAFLFTVFFWSALWRD